ncbi:helix-turn-helix domain-containing protein [Photobacterium damselae subsp. damselae]|uniref:helix-turn-helix transcriptional regulator n=1 Tax=Photobacterium damselae TaxID=38293 RepID=UPI00311B21E8
MLNPLLSSADVAAIVGRSPITIYRWMREGLLPPPIMVKGRVLGWRESVIDDWLEKQH